MDKKLTICFLGTAASIHTIKWARFFADEGHDVHLISYDRPEGPIPENINLYLIGQKLPFKMWRINTLLNLPLALYQTIKIVKRIKPDIIHAHYITSYGHLALFSGVRPLVLTAWGSDVLIAPKKSVITKTVVKSVLKRADLITCDANHVKEAMIGLGADSSKISIIYFGIDTNEFSPGPKDVNLEKKLNFSGKKTIISLRNLEPIYNIESLIEAAQIVSKEFSDVKFIIAGRGSSEKKLKKMVQDFGIEKNINFVGFIPNKDSSKYLLLADVYVSTSLSDGGIAASTAEAMACGLPVVISDSADNKDWVKDGESGFMVPVKSPKILAEKIITLLKDEDLRRILGKNARQVIKEKNDYYKEMGKMENLYKQLISQKK